MQKIAILLLTILLFSEEKIYAQETIKVLTDYKTDRKSLQFVSSYKEYLLVDNGEYNLDVLSINDEGQLYKVFESDVPYCVDGKTVRANINDTHIMFYYGDHLILQNFHTGETRRVDNLPQFESEIYPTAHFVGTDYYNVRADSNYLYFLDNDALQGIYEYVPSVKGDFLKIYKRVNNETKTLVEYVPENKIFEFDNNDEIFYNTKFPGFMYQHQPFGVNSIFSEKFKLYMVNEYGVLDSINRPLPRFSFVEKAKYSSSLLMLSEQLDDVSWDLVNIFYKYDLSLDTLIPLDTLRGYDFYSFYLLTDSLYSYKDYEKFYIGNLYTNEKIAIDIPDGSYFSDHVQSKLVFMDIYNAIYVYDYYDRTLNKLTDVDILSYRNVNRLKRTDKAYYFDLDQLTFPLYEVSDSIYSYNQSIATSANQNGLRTSFLQKSDNYIFTFEDDGIVVLDTNQTDGYRKNKLINHTINLGCFEYGWYEYKDVVYGQIPIYKDGKKYYELVSLNLENFEYKNLTEDLGLLSFEGDAPTYLSGFNGFLILNKNLIDIERQTVFDLSPYYSGNGTREVLKLENKVILKNYSEIIEFTYPELIYIRTIKIKSIRQIGDKYFAYNTSESPDFFIFTDGINELTISDLKDFSSGNFYDYITHENAVVMANYKTNQIRMYSISNDTDGSLLVEKVYDKIFDDISYVFERHTEEYICFSVQTPSGDVSHFYNQLTKTHTELKGRFVRKLIDIYDDQIVFLNDSLRTIEKINLDGQVLKSLDYLANTTYIYPDIEINNGHKGLYILNNSSYSRSSKLVFDSESFSYVYDSGCEDQFFTKSFQNNVVYKDSAYYFNIDISEKGRQIYRLHNPYDNGISPTNDEKISTFGIYPNPVTSALDIKTTEPCAIHSLKVYDYLGRSYAVLHQPCETTIQVDHLEQGAYIIELIEDNHRKVARFVKM